MTANGEDGSLHLDSVVKDSRPLKTSLVDGKPGKEHYVAQQKTLTNGTDATVYKPLPPLLPRLSKSSRSSSLEETVRNRRLRNSQESLSDRADTGSSTDSLKEEMMVSALGAVVSATATISNQDSSVRPLSAASTRQSAFRNRGSSLSEVGRRPRSQQSDLTEHGMRISKLCLSPVRASVPLPALEKSFVSATIKAAKRIDRDCLDYAVLAREKLGERLHRNLSDSRLLENMGSDNASVNSLRSTYSVLSPIRPQDVRNRYSKH